MANPGARRLLFVTYGGGHVHMVYPVVKALWLSEAFVQGRLNIQVLALPAAAAVLKANGIADSLGFRDFLDPAVDADALAWGECLAQQHHSVSIGASYEDSVAYLGLNYRDLVLQHGEADAAALFALQGRQAFFPLGTMARIFDRQLPDFLVTTNSPRSEAAAITIANQRGVGSLSMTDLLSGLGTLPMKAANITFLNEVAQKMYLANGIVDPAISEFHITGNPAFDCVLDFSAQMDSAWLARQFPGLGSRKAVLHADTPAYWDTLNNRTHFVTEDETLAELEACWSAVRAHGGTYLLRPHPSQDRAVHERWLAGRPDAFLAADCELNPLLASIDLLLVRGSTVGLQAALMRKRVMQLQSDLHSDVPLAAMGVAWPGSTGSHLHDEIGRALGDQTKFDILLNRIGHLLPAELAAPKVARIILRELDLQ